MGRLGDRAIAFLGDQDCLANITDPQGGALRRPLKVEFASYSMRGGVFLGQATGRGCSREMLTAARSP